MAVRGSGCSRRVARQVEGRPRCPVMAEFVHRRVTRIGDVVWRGEGGVKGESRQFRGQAFQDVSFRYTVVVEASRCVVQKSANEFRSLKSQPSSRS